MLPSVPVGDPFTDFSERANELRELWYDRFQALVAEPALSLPPLQRYPYRHDLQHLRVPFSIHTMDAVAAYRGCSGDLCSVLHRTLPPSDWAVLTTHAEAYCEDLIAMTLTAVPLPQEQLLQFVRAVLRRHFQCEGDAALSPIHVHAFLWEHSALLSAQVYERAVHPNRGGQPIGI